MVTPDVASPAFSAGRGGVTLSDLHPRVHLMGTEGGASETWQPDSTPQVSEGTEETPLGPARVQTLTWVAPAGYRLAWIVTLPENRNAMTLQCRLTNTGDEPLRVKAFDVLRVKSGALTLEGDPADWMTSTRYMKYAKYYDTVADLVRRGQTSQDHTSRGTVLRKVPYEEDLTIYTDDGKRGISISAVTDQSYLRATLQVPEDGMLGLTVESEMSGVRVDPGESRVSERVLVSFEDWLTAGEDVVTWLREAIPPRATPPLFGWCSWYCVAGEVVEEHCVDLARFVKEHRDRYPFEVIQVDEGWQVGRHVWLPNVKFASGMRSLAGVFTAAGADAGVWMTPISPNSQRVFEGRMYNFGQSQGNAVRSFDENWYVGYRNGEPLTGNLDPSSPGAREYLQGTLVMLRDQGYRYFKTDFSQVARMDAAYHDPKLTSFQVQRLLYGLMREAIGEDSYLLACNGGPVRAVLGLADATRIGTDTMTKWGFCHGVNDYGKPDNVHGAWFPMLQVGAASLYTRLMACDPDVTRVDHRGVADYDPRFNGRNPRNPDEDMPEYVSLAEVQTFHGMQGLFGGIMMISDLIHKPGYQQHNRLRMVEIMHPVTPDKGWSFAGGSDVWAKEFGFVAERPWGNFVSMLVWNPDHEEPRDLGISHVPLEKIGERFHLWSFWEEQYLGIRDASYVFEAVPKYHSRLVRLTPVAEDGRPTLIGSNFHMSMGSAEIKTVSASTDSITVELFPSAAAIEGQLVFFSRRPLKVTDAVGCHAFAMQSDTDVYTAVITERDRAAPRHAVTLEVSEVVPPTLESVKQDHELIERWRAGTMTVLK